MNRLKELIQTVEGQLGQLGLEGKPARLYEPMDYIMRLGGKRIRPAMVLAAYRLYAKDLKKEAIDLAMAVEMFHNFSLLHDDIMDRAELRRGRESVHIKWDEPTAILSGDLLLIKVYNQLTSLGDIQLLSDFNQMATALCEGQMMDMEFEQNETVAIDDYLQMIEKKTAVLLAYSLASGARLAGAEESDVKALYNLGIHLGLSFQLIDDYLDAFGDQEQTGKKVGGDILEQKKTYLWNNMMLHLSSEERKEVLENRASKEDEEYIQWVKQIMLKTDAPVATRSLAAFHHNKALEIFNALNIRSETAYLEDILNMLSSRTH